jgi:predicted  nucleic acid-binding Zn-ribbon protein
MARVLEENQIRQLVEDIRLTNQKIYELEDTAKLIKQSIDRRDRKLNESKTIFDEKLENFRKNLDDIKKDTQTLVMQLKLLVEKLRDSVQKEELKQFEEKIDSFDFENLETKKRH